MVGDKASGWGNRSEQVAEPWLKRLQRGGPQTRRSWGTQRKRSTWLPSHLVSGHSDTHAGLVRNVAAIIHLNTQILILPLAASRPGHAAASGHVLDHEPILSPFWHPIPHPAHAWLPFPSTTSRDNHAVYDCIDATSILSHPPSTDARSLRAPSCCSVQRERFRRPSSCSSSSSSSWDGNSVRVRAMRNFLHPHPQMCLRPRQSRQNRSPTRKRRSPCELPS